MKKIIFICLGNICRSPMAEYILRQMATKRNIAVEVSSAGTSGWHDGEQMHCGTADILNKLNIDSSNFKSKKVTQKDWEYYDYLIVMDDNNLTEMKKRFGQNNKLFKITELLPKNNPYDHVPDPWYTGRFEETHQIIQQCCEILLTRIEQGIM